MDAILVVNAGSSSLKFQIFGIADGEPRAPRPRPDRRHRRPAAPARRRRRRRRAGRPRAIAPGDVPDLPAAIGRDPRLAAHARGLRAPRHRPPRRARRPGLRRPGADRRRGARPARRLPGRSRRCTSRTISRRSASRWRSTRPCRRSPASTPPSTAAMPRTPTATPCRARFYDEGVRRYGFHGLSYEYIAERLREVAPEHRRAAASSSPISAAAPRCARSWTAAASRAPWASPRSTACRWAPAPASSTPASCST